MNKIIGGLLIVVGSPALMVLPFAFGCHGGGPKTFKDYLYMALSAPFAIVAIPFIPIFTTGLGFWSKQVIMKKIIGYPLVALGSPALLAMPFIYDTRSTNTLGDCAKLVAYTALFVVSVPFIPVCYAGLKLIS